MKILKIIIILLFFINTGTMVLATAPFRSVKTALSGEIVGLVENDEIKLVISEYFINDTYLVDTIRTKVQDGRFLFDLSRFDHAISINIYLPKIEGIENELLNRFRHRTAFILRPGDDIKLTYKDNDFLFTGRNADAYNVQYTLSGIYEDETAKAHAIGLGSTNRLEEYFEELDKALTISLNYLKKKQNILDQSLYMLLRNNLVCSTANFKYFLLNRKKIKSRGVGNVSVMPKEKIRYNDDLVEAPTGILSFILSKITYEKCTSLDKKSNLSVYYNTIKEEYNGTLREHLLAYLVVSHLESDSILKYSDLVLADLKNPKLRAKIHGLTTGRIEGQIIQDYTLTDLFGKVQKISDYKGKVVIMDFWFTGCGACQEIMPYLKSTADKFNPADVVFLSISTDKDRARWEKSVAEGKYSFASAVKLLTSGLGKDHPIIKDLKIYGYPRLKLLDKEGRLMRNPIDPRIDNGQDIKLLIAEKLK